MTKVSQEGGDPRRARRWGALMLALALNGCSSDSAPPTAAVAGASSAGATAASGAPSASGGAAPSNGGTPNGGATAAAGTSASEAGAAGSSGGVGGASDAGSAGNAAAGRGGATGASGASGASGNGRAGAAGNSTTKDPNEVEVFLLGGQSNATGQGYTKNLPAGFTVDTKVQLFHSADIISGAAPNTWIPLRHASEAPDSCGDRFGPELGFGNNIEPFYATLQLAIIKHAKSATDLVSQWAPGSSAQDTAHFGPEFKTFVATVDAGLKALRAKGKVPVLRAMLWQQGENDADRGGATSADYGKHLTALIARVREQWSAPDMLFVYGYVYPSSNYGTGRDDVRAAEKNVDQDSGNALATKGAFVVETDGLELRAQDPNSCYKSDMIHFGTAGQLELGKRMASKVHDKLVLPL